MPRPSKAIYRDDDDRPRREQRDSGGVPVVLVVFGGAGALLVLAAVAAGAWFFLARSSAKPAQAPELVVQVSQPSAPVRKPPPGWTDVRDAEGGYQVFLPGTITKGQPQLAGPLPAGVQMTLYAGPGEKVTAAARSIKPAGPITAGTTPDQMFGWLSSWNLGVDPKTADVVSRTPVTLGGKPGLLVRVKERGRDFAKVLDKEIEVPKDEFKDAFELLKEFQTAGKEMQKKLQDDENARPKRHELYFVTTNGQRVIVIHLKQAGEYPDEATLTAITGSFEFQ